MAAIYMWISGEVMYLSTTLYPIEVVDALQLGAQLGNGHNMLPIPNDETDYNEDIISLNWRQILKSAGPYYDETDYNETIVSLSWRQLLKETGPYYEETDYSEIMVAMFLDLALVIGDTPDEALEFSCELSTIDCSMTHI